MCVYMRDMREYGSFVARKRGSIKKWLLSGIFFSLFLAFQAFSKPIWDLSYIGTEQGLPQSVVMRLAQDHDGFIWVGTEAGIARYDGQRFKSYQPPGNGAVINGMVVDPSGHIWMSWFANPLTRLDPKTGAWEIFDFEDSVNRQISKLVDLGEGRYWVLPSFEFHYYDLHEGRFLDAEGLESDETGSVYVLDVLARNNRIYLASGNGVYVLDSNLGFIEKIQGVASTRIHTIWENGNDIWISGDKSVYKIKGRHAIPVFEVEDTRIIRVLSLSNSKVLVATTDQGIYVLSAAGKHLKHIRSLDTDNGMSTTTIYGMHEDGKGNLWVLSIGKIYLLDNDRIQAFKFDSESVTAHTILEGRGGEIWLGSDGQGLVKLSPYKTKFRTFKPAGQSDFHVRKAAFEKATGTWWLASNGDGIYSWKPDSNEWNHWDFSKSPGRAPNVFRSMKIDHRGNIWTSSSSRVYRWSEDTASWIVIKDQESMNVIESLPDNRILMAGTGLIVFDPASLSFVRYDTDPKAYFKAMLIQPNGNVLLGSHGGGVHVFNPMTLAFSRLDGVDIKHNLFSFYQAGNILWAGTWGGGLNRINLETGQSQVFLTTDGLSDNTVFGILPGSSDEFWLSTFNGLTVLSNCPGDAWPCEPDFAYYGPEDGLQGKEFDAEAFYKSPDGQLYFGGANGFNVFRPEEIIRNDQVPELKISEVLLNGVDLPVDTDSPEVKLKHDFGILTIRYAVMDFHDPVQNRYRYRFDGQNSWHDLGKRGEIVLTNLGVGVREIELQGSHLDDVWSKQPITFRLRVLPPFYLGPVAFILYFLALVLLFLIFSRWREARLKERNILLEQEVAERTRGLKKLMQDRDEFYANVSHEIRTPLTLLLAATKSLDKNKPGNDVTIQESISRHAGNLLRYVNQLLDVAHTHSTEHIHWHAMEARNYFLALIQSAKSVCEQYDIQLVLGDMPDVSVKTHSHSLDTIFGNLLVNALKHTPAGGEIEFSASLIDKNMLEIRVMDTGPGFPPEILGSALERGVKSQAENAWISSLGIGLSLVKESVDGMGGSVQIENREEGGACFKVCLPLAGEGLQKVHPENNDHDFNNLAAAAGTTPMARAGKGEFAVMVVEDNADLRGYLVDILKDDYKILALESAELAEDHLLDELPDLVISDVMLPGRNGFQLLQRIKENIATDHIQVLMLTAMADEESRLHGLKHKADAYLAKPFSEDELKFVIRNLLFQRQVMEKRLGMKAWCSRLPEEEGSRSGFEVKLMQALEALYNNPDASVSDIAAALNVTSRTLSRKVDKHFAASPNELLYEFRMQRAAEMLRLGNGVSDSAFACGFSNLSHFSKKFSERFGKPPSRFA